MPLRHTCASGVLALLLVAPARPWSAATHAEVALLALRRLPPGSGPGSREARAAYRRGAVAPDRSGRPGWIPARRHVLHARDHPSESAEGVIRSLETWLGLRVGERDAGWWFHAGRLAHLVADLCQPLHTDQDPREGRVHSSFERRVAGLPWEPGGYRRPGPPGEPTPARRLAEVGRRSYPDLLRELLERDESPALERRARRWRRRAVREVAARLVALLAGRRSEPGTESRGLAYLGLAIAWGLLLRRRSATG